jgi:serine/threonine-protein kinase
MPGTDSLILPSPTDSLNPDGGPPDPVPTDGPLEPGTPVAGLEIVRLVGEGSMGRVYEAMGPDGERFALKLLKPGKAEDPANIQDFHNEAEATGSVVHENVVRHHGYGFTDGHHYILMEFVDGPTLHRLLVKRKRLPWRQAVSIAIQVARGLGAAHTRGLVHRDVKPENVLLFRDGRVRLTDFGIVKDISSLKGFLLRGDQVGTAAYASPEQIEGKRLDASTDMYSLGATLYHMICGREPFKGRSPREIMKKALEEPIVPPCGIVADVPKVLSNTVLKMMAKRQTDRHPSTDRLIKDLEMILEGKVAIADAGPRVDTSAVGALKSTRSIATEIGRKRSIPPEVILIAVLLAIAVVFGVLALV